MPCADYHDVILHYFEENVVVRWIASVSAIVFQSRELYLASIRFKR